MSFTGRQHSTRYAEGRVRDLRRAARALSVGDAGRRGRTAQPLDQPHPLPGARRPSPSSKVLAAGAARMASSASFRATTRTAGSSRCVTASSGCASASRAGGSATRATPSTRISCSRHCASKANCRDICASRSRCRGQQRAAAAHLPGSKAISPRSGLAIEAALRGRDRQDRRENPGEGSRDPVGLRDRGAGRLRRRAAACRRKVRSSAISTRSASCRP